MGRAHNGVAILLLNKQIHFCIGVCMSPIKTRFMVNDQKSFKFVHFLASTPLI